MRKINYYDNSNVISKRVRYFRKLRNISQGQLAARLQVMNINIEQQGISSIENNSRIVTDYELACLCRALGVTVEEMLSDFYEEYPE
ncbi:helix-turn-helix transcriptional regulator [uncultured Oscillibacter sp.]|uniref:helix-turn-helix domain-containing protein n=1 Tax=uncultured Oscillibacter sp. TaxID=876091 RepID=UPI002605C372|nr:helix-turn-helix transcriptional regulator [uncultured Oscillibacter sp.]